MINYLYAPSTTSKSAYQQALIAIISILLTSVCAQQPHQSRHYQYILRDKWIALAAHMGSTGQWHRIAGWRRRRCIHRSQYSTDQLLSAIDNLPWDIARHYEAISIIGNALDINKPAHMPVVIAIRHTNYISAGRSNLTRQYHHYRVRHWPFATINNIDDD